jgi:uncharacterized protein
MTILNLQELLICRSILSDDAIKKLLEAIASPQEKSLQYEFAAKLISHAERLHLSGNILRAYIIYLLSRGDNMVAHITEKSNGKLGTSLHNAFVHDMDILQYTLNTQPSEMVSTTLLDDYEPTKNVSNEAMSSLYASLKNLTIGKDIADAFISYYRRYGYGDIASYRAFRWDKQHLVGIRHFELVRLTDLIGYEHQKKQLIANTAAFAAGKPANNVLLVGSRGTGKSTSVKALANEYYAQGLRLLQITKAQLIELPKIMELLRQFASKKFIIFLDDLSFEEFEVEYKYLKSAIEGGVESRPANVLIYATSNRRHIIKETWHDREDTQEELYRNDSVNETISLSDRFGLIISYTAPSQNEYLAIIDALLKKENISLDDEELRIQALRWEITHSGRSGRTAQQFVTNFLGHR